MTKNNQGPLTHHERLRYSYLLKNLGQLNGQQASEFYYLQGKIDAYEATQAAEYAQGRNVTRPIYQEPYDGLQSYERDNRLDYEGYREAQYGLTAEGLPIYQEEVSSTKTRKKKPAKKRVTQSQVQPPKKARPKNTPKTKHPPKNKKKRLRRILKTAGFIFSIAIIVVFIGIARSFLKGADLSASGNNGKTYEAAIRENFNGQDTKDGVNILILGSDQRVTQGSSEARTDSIMVLNVGNKEGKIKMVSFMRDTLVNIKGASNDDYNTDLKLNTAFNIGEQNNNQGAELMRETLKRNFDIDIKYYVMVDFETFAAAVDELFPEGVEINAKFGTVDGKKVNSVEVPDDLNMDEQGQVTNQTIKVGKQRMDGRTLLNYARFRKDDDGDFGRTQRQQQVIQAVVQQVKNPSKLFTGSAALGKVFSMTSTNLSMTEILDLGISNMGDFSKGITSQTIPVEGDWIDAYDMYGGEGIDIDFNKYQEELKKLGFR